MKVLFCRSHAPWSWLIRLITWSRWSHVALVHGDDVIEAVLSGVRLNTVEAVIASSSRYHIAELPCADPEAAWRAALLQVGRPYDWRADLGILIHRDEAERGRWNCSGLTAWAVLQGGTRLFRHGLLGQITPQSLWMLPGE